MEGMLTRRFGETKIMFRAGDYGQKSFFGADIEQRYREIAPSMEFLMWEASAISSWKSRGI